MWQGYYFLCWESGNDVDAPAYCYLIGRHATNYRIEHERPDIKCGRHGEKRFVEPHSMTAHDVWALTKMAQMRDADVGDVGKVSKLVKR